MRVVIVGGGIAGLAASIALRRVGISSTVCERSSEAGREGLGFILLGNGLQVLEDFGLGESVRTRGHSIDRCLLRSQSGRELLSEPLSGAMGFKRNPFIRILKEALPPQDLRMGSRFTHFQYDESQRAVSACFENGGEIHGDFFIGSDGIRSEVRREMFPDHSMSPVRVKELVCLVHAPPIAESIGSCFLKTQHERGGLALGIVPCGDGDLIWYLQFDSHRWDLCDLTPEGKKAFAIQRAGEWPDPIPRLLEITDYSTAHVWHTSDMDLLPVFHRRNVLLIGDAAHAFLTFTSQGVNSALQDAQILAEQLKKMGKPPGDLSLERALASFSQRRREMVGPYIEKGRSLAERFLFPDRFPGDGAVPLIK